MICIRCNSIIYEQKHIMYMICIKQAPNTAAQRRAPSLGSLRMPFCGRFCGMPLPKACEHYNNRQIDRHAAEDYKKNNESINR